MKVLRVALVAVVLAGCTGSTVRGATGGTSPARSADAVLQTLAIACKAHQFGACDQLWSLSDVGSDFEQLAASCGGSIPAGETVASGDCTTRFGGSTTTSTGNGPTSSPSLAPSTTARSVTAATGSGESPLLVDPAPNSWIVVIASLAEAADGSQEHAVAEAARLREQGVAAAVLRTEGYPSLSPGYWVVYSADGFADEAATKAACGALLAEGKVGECYARYLGEAVQGSITREQAADFIIDYFRTAGARHYEDAWALLSKKYQDAYGGYDSFVRFWDRVKFVGPSSLDATEVASSANTIRISAPVFFDLVSGEHSEETITVTVVRDDDGRLLLDEYSSTKTN